MRTLTILIFGAVPATLFGLMALYASVIGVWVTAGGEPSGLLHLLWGVATIVGVFCLWIAAFTEVCGKLAVGLTIGVCGISAFAFGKPGRYGLFDDLATTALLTASLATMLVLLFRYVVARFDDRSVRAGRPD